MKEREFSVTKREYKRYLKAVPRKELNTAKIKMKCNVLYELFKDTLIELQSSQNLWVMYLFLEIGTDTYFIQVFHGTSSLYWKRIDSGRKGKIKIVKQSFLLQRILLNMTRRKKSLTVYWIRLSKAQDQGLEF